VSQPFREEALALLSAPPSREALLRLIAWIDLACVDAPITGAARQLLARAVVAVGPKLLEHADFPTVRATLQAAERFVHEPTEAHFDAYQRAATNSYPFGPGDGCFAIAETGYAGCQPGSGCSSGAGCLNLPQIGDEIVMLVLAEELIPWLEQGSEIA
jgi:hypothetical protein